MLFSLIIPVYNVENYLDYCLNSIVSQDFLDYEIIIVDDGSTDDSASIYARFAAEARVPVQIVKQKNSGLLQARRAGIRVARGDYLWHVDGDDGLAPHAMVAVSKEIEKSNPDLVLIGASDSDNFDQLLPGTVPGQQCFFQDEDVNDIRLSFLSGAIPSICFKIARRTCVDIDRDYSEYGKLQLGEDQLQSIYILDKARSVSCLREPLYYYRANRNSITAQYREGLTSQYVVVKEAIYQQALIWDKVWPGGRFSEVALTGYLSNGFYDMRKNVDGRNYSRQFQEFRDSSLYGEAFKYRPNLRVEQRMFYSLFSKGPDLFSYWYLSICRAAVPLVRKAAACLHRC